jgi:hypothetical protein
MGNDVNYFFRLNLGVTFKQANLYRMLDEYFLELGFSWLIPHSRHPKQSEAVHDAFKQLPRVNDP